MRVIVPLIILILLIGGALYLLGNQAGEVEQQTIEQEVQLGGDDAQ